jgi:hypothetical protein
MVVAALHVNVEGHHLSLAGADEGGGGGGDGIECEV